jgi:hypothetical protein
MRRTAALAVLVMTGALCAQAAAAPSKLEHRHELSALFTLDRGWRPVSDFDLRQYDLHFHKILASCKIGAEHLTNSVIFLAYKAGDQGQRVVTNLMMMKAITRRITWKGKASCGKTFNVAEGYMENGGP